MGQFLGVSVNQETDSLRGHVLDHLKRWPYISVKLLPFLGEADTVTWTHAFPKPKSLMLR